MPLGMIYPFSSILMKKLGFKKVNRPQFRFVFAQILPLSIVTNRLPVESFGGLNDYICRR
jgi:hypothetical protein